MGLLCHRSRPSDHWLPVAPEKTRHGILEVRHDAPSAGHLDQHRTLVEVSEKFCWPRLGSGRGGCSSGHLIDASSRLFKPSPCAATWTSTRGNLRQRNFLHITNVSSTLYVSTGSNTCRSVTILTAERTVSWKGPTVLWLRL